MRVDKEDNALHSFPLQSKENCT